MQRTALIEEKLPMLKEYSPPKEAFSTQNTKKVEKIPPGNICISYGISLEVFAQLEKRLEDPKVQLLFLEDSLEELFLFAQNPKAAEVLFHSQVVVHYLQNALALEDFFRKILWENILNPPVFVNVKERTFVENLFLYFKEGALLTFSDYSSFGERVLKNVAQNLSSLSSLRKVEDAENSLQGIPAFIVGAGPSLDEDYKVLHREKGVIFAGGSAVAVLKKKGVTPHFAATIDKEASNYIFREGDLKEPYFLFQMRANPENVALGKKPPILAASNGGYPLEDFLTKSFGIYEPAKDCGWNVSTFLCRQALLMGCSPIILVGQDLCHYSTKAYAEDLAVKKEKTAFCKAKDRSGKEVITQRDWLFARDWFCHFAKQHPGILQNGTSRGLAFPGIEDAKELSVFKENIDLLVEKAIEHLPIYPVVEKKVGMKESVENSKSFAKKALTVLQNLYETNKDVPEDFFSPLGKELFYQHHIRHMWALFGPMILQKGDQKPHTKALQKLLFVEEMSFLLSSNEWYSL